MLKPPPPPTAPFFRHFLANIRQQWPPPPVALQRVPPGGPGPAGGRLRIADFQLHGLAGKYDLQSRELFKHGPFGTVNNSSVYRTLRLRWTTSWTLWCPIQGRPRSFGCRLCIALPMLKMVRVRDRIKLVCMMFCCLSHPPHPVRRLSEGKFQRFSLSLPEVPSLHAMPGLLLEGEDLSAAHAGTSS